jgi:hypothetical protein
VVYVTPGAGFESDSGGRFTVTGATGTTQYDVDSGTWEVSFYMPTNSVDVIGNFIQLPTPTPTPTLPPSTCHLWTSNAEDQSVVMSGAECGGGNINGMFDTGDTICLESDYTPPGDWTDGGEGSC